MLKICIPIQAETVEELKKILPLAERDADLVEIWLDHLKNCTSKDLTGIIKNLKKPLIVVCKGAKEKGQWRRSEEKRVRLLIQASLLGADFVDVGLHTKTELIKKIKEGKKSKTQLIISYHNFKKTPSLKILKKAAVKALELGADLVKIATFANDKVDNYTIFELLCWFNSTYPKKKIIALCMGKHGQLSRIHNTYFGSFLTFAALGKNQKSAAGQLTVTEIKALINKELA